MFKGRREMDMELLERVLEVSLKRLRMLWTGRLVQDCPEPADGEGGARMMMMMNEY